MDLVKDEMLERVRERMIFFMTNLEQSNVVSFERTRAPYPLEFQQLIEALCSPSPNTLSHK